MVQQTYPAEQQPATADPFYHGSAPAAPGCGPGGCNATVQTTPVVGEEHYSPSGVVIQRYGENIPLQYDPTSAQLAQAQAANPGRIDTNSQLVRAGPYVIPQDVFYALYTPNDAMRFNAAKDFMGQLGHQIGGGTTAAPGTTGTVHVNAAGVAVPNPGASERAANANVYAGTQSYSLIAGSPQAGWQGQNLGVERATMPFQPEGLITLQKMNGQMPSYAIPTASLDTNNPWNPNIVNQAATERANQLAAGLVVGREGYSPEFGKTFLESAQAVKTYEGQKFAAQARGDLTGALYAQNQEQRAANNLNEWSRAYHEAGKQMGIPVAANKYEVVGDVAVEFLKGTPTRAPEAFSPLSGDLLGILPTYKTPAGTQAGLGVQQDAWNQAVARYGGKDVNLKDFSLAATYISDKAAQGWQGPYGDLYGGQNYKGTTITAPLGEGVGGPKVQIAGYEAPAPAPAQLPAPFRSTYESPAQMPGATPAPSVTPVEQPKGSDWIGNLLRSPMLVGITAPLTGGSTQRSVTVGSEPSVAYTGTEGLPAPYKSVSTPAVSEKMTVFGFEVPQPIAAFSKGLSGFESSIRSYLPSTEVGERAARVAEYTNPFMAPYAMASTLTETVNPKAAGEARTAESLMGLRGQYTQFYERPTLTATSFGVGAVFGGGAKVVTAAYEGSRALAAERIISSGGIARAADIYGNAVMKTAPEILKWAYVADVGIRSTQGLTNFSPESVAPRARGITMQETVPMGAGFVRGYETPGAVYSKIEPAVQRARLEFPQFVEEAGSVAKAIPQYAGYKVTSSPIYEAATSPITRAKLELPQFVEEAGGSTARGVAGYAQYKIQRPIEYIQARADVGVERLLHPARFAGVEGTENIYRPRSTLNIFGREQIGPSTRALTGEQSPIPKGTVEVRSSSGQVQLARVEQQPIVRVEQIVSSDSRMMPEYPRGPSPIPQRYSIEEETQYLTLPPGMVSPGPKRTTVQELVSIPATAMGQVQGQIVRPVQKTFSEQISRQSIQQVRKPASEISPKFDITPVSKVGITTSPLSVQVPAVRTAQLPSTGIIQVPFQETVPGQRTGTIQTSVVTQYGSSGFPNPEGFSFKLPPLLPAFPFGGGGGGSGFGRKRRRAFLEVFPMGLDIAGPVLKLSSPPKPPRVSKTGGSKAAKSMKGKYSKSIKVLKTKKK